ncbi:MAG: CocE/NonD family hydrolase [Beijerinckiaceae bacterium]|nr:CocE/NonD family hydrolase [Beijerinckiaceae bacterium]
MANGLLPVAEPETVTLRLSDGVDLVADIYRPVSPGHHPVMLMRQPYGRAIASTQTLAHPAWYAAHGYVVAVQDVRGRGGSKGKFRLFRNEIEDGAATLDWAAGLSGTDGQVAMYGSGYQAVTQFLALAGAIRAGTKRPDAIVPAMGAWTIRDDWAYTGGAFGLAGNIGWACQIGAEAARLAGHAEAFAALSAAARGTPWAGPRPARPEVLERFSAFSHYAEWLADDPATWAATAPARLFTGRPPGVPGLHIGGWQDFLLDGTLGGYAACEAGEAPQRLIVGPWAHAPWGRRVGALDLGPEAVTSVDLETVAFLDHELKGYGAPGPEVSLFDIGAKTWCHFSHWPEAEPVTLFLTSDGRAATASTGELVVEPGAYGHDHLVHDPWRPAPVVGGAWGAPGGYQDRAAIDDRSDVAAYSGAPLTRSYRLVGEVTADLFIEADAPAHDIHATLSIITPDGRVIALTSGHLRVPDAMAFGPRRVKMRAVCTTLYPGQALRLSVQAAAWPAFTINPGTGRNPEQAETREAMVTTLAIRHGGGHPSRVFLPVID